ncbi:MULTISPECIES: PBP1A family penicillin-binding protein [Rhodomicrobium]|uniref:transglycosylase domain-containing protein n=1 Tax=Rhodomicrobium TaxID=1068 RepID=UPI001FDA246F|nr:MULTISPECIES: PBP1A family penicillin-binding protein [Rhodomicrobium]
MVDWWALDSWIDSSLYAVWAKYQDLWSGYSNFVSQFRVSGFRRIVAEFCSEAATLGTLGLIGVLTLALPSLESTNDPAWRTAAQYSVTFLDRNGAEIGKRGILYSDSVPLEEIPDNLIKATLATEDRRFFEHFGVDVLGTARAMVANVQANDVVQGGSSLTQQLAKNLFLSSERSFERKVKEAFIALWLEARLSKKEILKLYLDRSYMGGGTFGVEAASQFYFGKSVREINLAESALLAGLFKAPTKFAPHANAAESRARANQVLTNMVDAGFMTEGQVHGARLNPAKVIDNADSYTPNYFLDWAYDETQRLMQKKGEYNLVARTTVDIALQKAAEQAVETTLDQNSKSLHVGQAALVSMETDGAVRAMVGGRDYGESQFNRATKAYRQPGSSFKTYVYLTALENGAKPNQVTSDSPVSCGNWSPSNYSGGFRGRMTLTTALALSINTVAVKLSFDYGREKVLDTLQRVGLTQIKKSCSMALGDQGVTPLQHTSGYATLASGGKQVKGYAITEIRNSQDQLVYSRANDEPPAKQIFDRKAVETMNEMLTHVITEGTGRAAALDFTSVAGKTGTSSDYRDAWFIGFTGQYVTGVWYGNDSFTSMNKVTGGALPARTWHDYMVAATTSYNIPQIPGVPLHPKQVEEMARIAEIKKDDPTLGTVAQGAGARRMPPKTRQMLLALTKMFKEAKPLDLNGVRGASLDGNGPGPRVASGAAQ